MTDSQDERTFWFVMRSTEIIGLIFLKYVEVRVRVVWCPSVPALSSQVVISPSV